MLSHPVSSILRSALTSAAKHTTALSAVKLHPLSFGLVTHSDEIFWILFLSSDLSSGCVYQLQIGLAAVSNLLQIFPAHDAAQSGADHKSALTEVLVAPWTFPVMRLWVGASGRMQLSPTRTLASAHPPVIILSRRIQSVWLKADQGPCPLVMQRALLRIGNKRACVLCS